MWHQQFTKCKGKIKQWSDCFNNHHYNSIIKRRLLSVIILYVKRRLVITAKHSYEGEGLLCLLFTIFLVSPYITDNHTPISESKCQLASLSVAILYHSEICDTIWWCHISVNKISICKMFSTKSQLLFDILVVMIGYFIALI